MREILTTRAPLFTFANSDTAVAMFSSTLIFLLAIALVHSARLDGSCTGDSQCEDTGTVCGEGRCRCRAPLYRPCNSTCVVNPHSAYEGEPCEVQAHCVENSVCSPEKRCQCSAGFPAKNGLCFKDINAVCSGNQECLSSYCSGQRCSCPPGSESFGDPASCRPKVVKIYTSWAEANSNNAFCVSSASCIDSVAECVAEPAHPTQKFCKCPYGYQVKDNNERCEPNRITLLSPLSTVQSSYQECGVCEDSHAACMTAASEKTCWCRSSYQKRDTRCVKNIKSVIVFPNQKDLGLHNFANDCEGKDNGQYRTNGQLCVCAAGHEFVAGGPACVPIRPRWIDDMQEYGVCTRVDSRDMAHSESDLCPAPLKCEQRRDKHVCSCGANRFLNPDNATQCVYFVGQRTNASDDACATNAVRNGTTGICECLKGHKAVNGNRACELKLVVDVDPARANASQPYDDVCTVRFGKRVYLSALGECRCSGVQSFPNSELTSCHAPLNQPLAAPMENCPANAVLNGNQCQCQDGYRPSPDALRCVAMPADLVDYRGAPNTAGSPLTDRDCHALFTGPVEAYDRSTCQCKSNAFVNDAATGCWYQLNATVSTSTEMTHCPPHTSGEANLVCVCEVGYIADGNVCKPSTTHVYADNDPNAPSVPNVEDRVCAKWFGTGSMKSANGNYCICKASAFAVRNNTYCHFFVDEQTADIKGARTCPANTRIEVSSTSRACVCLTGFYRSADRRTCETVPLPLVGAMNKTASPSVNCVNFTDNDCVAKFGSDAFCRNEKCYCDQRSSYVNAQGKCESYSAYVFPGPHERNHYSCETVQDCGGRANVVCDFMPPTASYKVCHCKEGSLLDPKTRTCDANRCPETCNAQQNFVCRGYECVCKEGYHLEGSRCVESASKLELGLPCNTSTALAAANSSIVCDRTCGRAQCASGYRTEGSQCVPYELDDEKCVYREDICTSADENAVCNRNDNECACQASYYKFEDKCVRAVGSQCTKDEQCGSVMLCKQQRCSCNDKQREQEVTDIFGRTMKRCVNGVGRMQFSALVLVLALVGRLFL